MLLLSLLLHCFVSGLVDSGPGMERRSRQCLDQVGPILRFNHPQRTFAEILRKRRTLIKSWLRRHQLPTSCTYRCLLHLLEAFVQRQVMPDAVLPSGRSGLKVRKVLHNPSVDLLHRESLLLGVLDRHEDQRTGGRIGRRLD